jgi:protein phosphatase
MKGLGAFLSYFKLQKNKSNSKITYSYSVGSHAGLVRELNEDSYLALPEYGLWVVADGMGGHEAGEIASQIAIQEISNGIKDGLSLNDAIASAHHAIQNAAQKGYGTENMGTTVVAVRLNELDYEIAWVGDSRAYLWNTALRQLTSDHSYVQLLLDSGLIAASEAASHPRRNVISQALGLSGNGHDTFKIDSVTGRLNENDALLLCSDGLNGEVSDKEIALILAQEKSNPVVVDRLIEAALAGGGRDNVTVIMVVPEVTNA